MEFLAAVHDGIRRDSQPMRLQTGLVEKRYDIKQLLSSGVSYKVMEGVHRETLKNHSLKIVGRGGRAKLRVVKALDALQVYELIASFVDEVFFHPNYVCICFKWGTHEVDSSHQLTAWIVDSLHLLRELLPPKQHTHFRLDVQDMQRLLLRATCLDCYLQSDLFIQ